MENARTDQILKTAPSYLLNVFEALKMQVLPGLGGATIDRLGECMTIIARVAHDLQMAGSTPAPLHAGQVTMRDLANADGAALDQAESAFAHLRQTLETQAAAGESRTFDPLRLEAYLKGHDLGGPLMTITKTTVLAGGRSKQTIMVEQTGAASLPTNFVIRQDWSSAVTGTSVVTEFELLKFIAGAGLKAPEPLILERDPAILGSPFLVMRRMPGKPQGDIYHPPKSANLAFDLARQLARLHSLPAETFDALGVPTEAYTAEQLRTGLDSFKETHRTIGLVSPTIDAALEWLESAIPFVQGSRSLVHNDLGCHNFLIESETLTAILDWELAHIGNPAADLGYIRNFIEKMTTWETFMASYEAAGGPKTPPHVVDFYTIWCGVRLFCLLMRARAGVSMGMVHDTEITYACAHFIPQQHHVISRELRRIVAQSGYTGALAVNLAASA